MIVLMLCGCAFLGAFAVAHAKEDKSDPAASAPAPLSQGSAKARVATIGSAATLPTMKRKKKKPAATPAPAAVAAPVRRSAPAPAAAPNPAPAPAPAPKPAPKSQPKSNQGTPFLNVH